MATIAKSVRLYGRVQGVFFRQWAVGRARTLGLNGWVRNRSEGSVEAHIAGEEAAVAQMVEHLRQGPPQARIDDFTVEDVEPEAVEGFSVRL